METATIDETTQRYLGQWQRLVSTTNWDKGRIICGWRQSLEESGAPPTESSDEAWSRRVGNVTPQHVGRLRRTWERFGAAANDYSGLYWSHFQAGTDWHDAEMWLEGAVQSNWSVLQMRQERANAHGLVDAEANAHDASATPWDDDAEPTTAARSAFDEAIVQDPSAAGERNRRNNDADPTDDGQDASSGDSWKDSDDEDRARTPAAESRQPFAELPSLPADVSEAFEAFKLCILRHKLAGWSEVSRGDVLTALDALKELAIAAASE